jgi:hypothetical protein
MVSAPGGEPARPAGSGSLGQLLGLVHSTAMQVPDRAVRELPHFDLGAWEIDRDMAGYLHQGESVAPTGFAAGMRGAAVDQPRR